MDPLDTNLDNHLAALRRKYGELPDDELLARCRHDAEAAERRPRLRLLYGGEPTDDELEVWWALDLPYLQTQICGSSNDILKAVHQALDEAG